MASNRPVLGPLRLRFTVVQPSDILLQEEVRDGSVLAEGEWTLTRYRLGHSRERWRGRFARLSRWWDRGPLQKLAVLAFIPVFLACAYCSGSMIFAATPYGQQLQRESEATETVQAAAQAQATAEAKAYALAHPKPTVTATSTPAPTSMAEPTAGTARATVDASAPVAKADGLTRPEAIRRFIERG